MITLEKSIQFNQDRVVSMVGNIKPLWVGAGIF